MLDAVLQQRPSVLINIEIPESLKGKSADKQSSAQCR